MTLRTQEQPSVDLQSRCEALEAENAILNERLADAQRYFDRIQQKIDTLTSPANQAVVVKGVQLDGRTTVDVWRSGGSHVRVAVSPDVDPERLKIGATGLLSREGNCLVEVVETDPYWNGLGTYERRLGGGRMMLSQDGRSHCVLAAESLAGVDLHAGDLIGFDDAAGMAYERLEQSSGEELFAEEVTPDDFNRLGGLVSQKAKIKQAIDCMIRYPNVAKSYGKLISGKHGLLFHGPPGCGKTALARCAAAYAQQLLPDRRCQFMNVTGSEDYSMWLGQAERRIDARFKAARRAAEQGVVIMFWDEFDAIARRRGSDFGSGAPDRILNTLLGLMDGVIRDEVPIVMIAATNRVDKLDEAVLRPGRFTEKIEVGPPNRSAAIEILLSYLSGAPIAAADADRPLDEIVAPLVSQIYSPNSKFSGMVTVKLADGRQQDVQPRELVSGATLEQVVRAAAKEAFSREVRTGQGGILAADLELALDCELRTTFSLLTRENVKSYVTSIPEEARPVDVVVNRHAAPHVAYTRAS